MINVSHAQTRYTYCERADYTISRLEDRLKENDNTDNKFIVSKDTDALFYISVFETVGDYKFIESEWHNALVIYDPERMPVEVTRDDMKRLVEWYKSNRDFLSEDIYRRYADIEDCVFDKYIRMENGRGGRIRKTSGCIDKQSIISELLNLITEFQNNKYGIVK